jgi:hypothetical protein
LGHDGSPVVLDVLNIGTKVLSLLVTEALLAARWKWVSHFKTGGRAVDALGVVGVVNSEGNSSHIIETGDFGRVIRTILDSKGDQTITEASLAVVGAWSWLVLRSWLTPALLGSTWEWITSHAYGGAHGPVVSIILDDSFPVSHLVEIFDGGVVVWSLEWSHVHGSLALAVGVLGGSAEPWLGVLISSRDEAWVLVADAHEVLVCLH